MHLYIWERVHVAYVTTRPTSCAVSACGGEWTVAGCQVRLAQCSPITRALTGPAGPVTSVLACLALSSLPANPTPDFFMSIGG